MAERCFKRIGRPPGDCKRPSIAIEILADVDQVSSLQTSVSILSRSTTAAADTAVPAAHGIQELETTSWTPLARLLQATESVPDPNIAQLDDQDAVGCQDPRPNVISKNLLDGHTVHTLLY